MGLTSEAEEAEGTTGGNERTSCKNSPQCEQHVTRERFNTLRHIGHLRWHALKQNRSSEGATIPQTRHVCADEELEDTSVDVRDTTGIVLSMSKRD